MAVFRINLGVAEKKGQLTFFHTTEMGRFEAEAKENKRV